jgi:Tol biopolymer transport system component
MGAYPFLLCFLLIQTLNVTPVTQENDIVGDLALSADGRRLAYWIPGPKGSGTMDLWIRDVATLRGEKVHPPESFGHSMVFAPDGNSLYFTAHDPAQPWVNHLYQWPLAGGEAKRIATHVDGPIGLSPDGANFAFLRNLGHSQNALIVRSVSTGTERTLARTDIGGGRSLVLAWSADGREIACPNGRELLLVSTQTGKIRKVAAPGIVWSLAWPSHGGLFATIDASIWRLDVARGSWEAISQKPDRYSASRICATPDGATLVAIRLDDMMPFLSWVTGWFGKPIGQFAYYSDVVLIHLPR